jgi:WD40 repeat protein
MDLKEPKDLLSCLEPLDTAGTVGRSTARFQGREWILKQIEDWLAGEDTGNTGPVSPYHAHLLWIQDGPGMGKSALMARLSQVHADRCAVHFFDAGSTRKNDPTRIIRSLAWQIAHNFASYRDRLIPRLSQPGFRSRTDATSLFEILLLEPLDGFTPPEGPIVVLLDALDEALKPGGEAIADFLENQLGRLASLDGVRVIISGRPEPVLKAYFAGLKTLSFSRQPQQNQEDLCEFIATQLDAELRDRHDAAAIVRHICDRSEGMFLYVALLAEAVKSPDPLLHLDLEHAQEVPVGIQGMFHRWLARGYPDVARFKATAAPVLGIVLAAREPIPARILRTVSGISDTEFSTLRQQLGSLFPTVKVNGEDAMRCCHGALAEWITSSAVCDYYVSLRDAHKRLAEFGLKLYARALENVETMENVDEYWLRHLPVHLAYAGRWSDLESLLFRVEYLSGRVRADGVRPLCDQLREILRPETVRQSAEPVSTRCIGLLERCLVLACTMVEKNEYELPSQIVARLQGFSDPPIVALVQEALAVLRGGPWLCPRISPVDRPEGRLIRVLDRQSFGSYLAVTRDRRLLLAPGKDGMAQVWDLAQERPIARFQPPAHIDSATVTPDGRYGLFGCGSGILAVWEIGTGETLRLQHPYTTTVNAVVCSPDNEHVATFSINSQAIAIWNLITRQSWTVPCPALPIVLSFSPDGQGLLVGSGSSVHRFEDFGRGEHVEFTIPAHESVGEECFDVRLKVEGFTPDGQACICSSSKFDTTFSEILAVCDLRESGAELRWHVEGATPHSILVLPDKELLIVGDFYGKITFRNLDSGAELGSFGAHSGSMELAGGDQRLVSVCGDDHTIKLWDRPVEAAQLDTGEPGEGWSEVQAVAVAPDGRYAVTSQYAQLAVWDTNTGRLLRRIPCHRGRKQTIGIGMEGTDYWVISCLNDDNRSAVRKKYGDEIADSASPPDPQSTQIYNLSTGDSILAAQFGNCVDLDGRCFLSYRDEGYRIYNRDGQILVVQGVPERDENDGIVAFRPDRPLVFARTKEHCVKVVDAVDSTELSVFGECLAASFVLSTSGEYLATANEKSMVLRLVPFIGASFFDGWPEAEAAEIVAIWDVRDPRNPKLHRVLHDHLFLECLALSADASQLAGIDDGCVYLWDVNGNMLSSYMGDGDFSSCALSPDGALVVAGDKRGNVHFLDVH